MTRVLVLIISTVAFATAAYADVTLKQTTTGKGMGMSGTTGGTTHIKGDRMRVDAQIGDRIQTSIYDLDAQKMYIFDSKKKEAEVWDMGVFAGELAKTVDTASMKVSLKPNGQTKEVAGQKTAGYDLDISLTSAMGGNKDMMMAVTLAGPAWIAKDAPGTADFMRFYKTAVEKGWVFSPPQQAKAQPGQAKAMAEMYRQLAEAGGIPYETDIQVKMGGEGPMAGLFAKLGNISVLTKVDSVETGPLSDDLFAPPAGYKLNQKK